MRTKNKLLSMLACALVLAAGCSKFDDSALWKAINENSAKIAALEEQCRQMNTDIKDLKVIVNALQTGDVITSVTPLADKTGYSITFKNAGTIVIRNGQDGSNGTNGKDGKDGKDGTDGRDAQTPVISVAQDTDGIYYWTLNGQWLLDVNGNKIRVQGENGTDGKDGVDGKDGADGKNGTDGLTPQFKIMDGYWYLSYDGETWEKLGKATGNNGSNGLDGLNGSDGDAFFKGVTMGDGFVIFMLNDGKDTLIKLPFVKEDSLKLVVEKAGTLQSLLTAEQMRSTINLEIEGELDRTDLGFLTVRMLALENLDLEKAIITETTPGEKYYGLNPLGPSIMSRTLRVITLPAAEGEYRLDNIPNLEKIYTSSSDGFGSIKQVNVPFFYDVEYKEGVEKLESINFMPRKMNYTFPSTLKAISCGFWFYDSSYYKARGPLSVTCLAATPPEICQLVFFGTAYNYDLERGFSNSDALNCTLYVPAESVELYKEATGWKQFQTILPIE